MNKKVFIFGLAIGVVNFLWLVTEYLTGLHDKHIELFFIITPFSMLIPVVGMGIAYSSIRMYFPGDSTYTRRLLPGMSVTFIAAVMSALGQYVYHKVVNPGFFEFALSLAREKGMPASEDYFNTASYVLQVFVSNLVVGLLATVLFAAVYKPKRNIIDSRH